MNETRQRRIGWLLSGGRFGVALAALAQAGVTVVEIDSESERDRELRQLGEQLKRGAIETRAKALDRDYGGPPRRGRLRDRPERAGWHLQGRRK